MDPTQDSSNSAGEDKEETRSREEGEEAKGLQGLMRENTRAICNHAFLEEDLERCVGCDILVILAALIET